MSTDPEWYTSFTKPVLDALENVKISTTFEERQIFDSSTKEAFTQYLEMEKQDHASYAELIEALTPGSPFFVEDLWEQLCGEFPQAALDAWAQRTFSNPAEEI